MASSSAQVEMGNGGGSGRPPERPTATHAQAQYSHARAYQYGQAYAHVRAFVSLAVKGSGLLALLLSTVVLLGGFVSSLGKTDFFCITVISGIQAAGIFNDWQRSLQYGGKFLGAFLPLEGEGVFFMLKLMLQQNILTRIVLLIVLLFVVMPLVVVVAAPLWLLTLCIDLIYLLGPLCCAAISSWCIAKLNHGNRDDGDSMTDMMAALNIFYSLVIFQGIMFGVLVYVLSVGDLLVARHLLALEQLSEKWGKRVIRRYISNISAKFRKDFLSIKGMDLINYAAELLDSKSQEDYLYGARLLNAFIKKGEDVRWLLLPSTHRIQRLMEYLHPYRGWNRCVLRAPWCATTSDVLTRSACPNWFPLSILQYLSIFMFLLSVGPCFCVDVVPLPLPQAACPPVSKKMTRPTLRNGGKGKWGRKGYLLGLPHCSTVLASSCFVFLLPTPPLWQPPLRSPAVVGHAFFVPPTSLRKGFRRRLCLVQPCCPCALCCQADKGSGLGSFPHFQGFGSALCSSAKFEQAESLPKCVSRVAVNPCGIHFQAANMEYTLLKKVDATSQQWTVRVRVIRFSKYMSPDDPNRIRRLDLVLLDEEGTAMDGQIPEIWIPQFLPKLTEESVYYIQYFQVCNAREIYRPVDHPYLMRFTAHTKLYEIRPTPAHFPQYAYNLATFEVLNTRLNETKYCSDAIGILKGCSHVKLQNTAKGTRPLRNVEIMNESGEPAVVALWGHHAHEFDAEKYIDMSNQGPVVLLFVALTCRTFDGKLSLQGSTLCRWYANPEIPEAMALRNSYAGPTAPATWIGPSALQPSPERTTIQELAKITNPHTIYSNRYIVNAQIVTVVSDQSWWYLACKKCNKKTETVDGAYKCKTYKCTGRDGGPRYSIGMLAKDPLHPASLEETATIQLVFFGSIAEELIGISVESLLSSHGNQTMFLPARITNLYGRQFELRISVSPRSLQRQNISYQVDTILAVINQPAQTPLPTTELPQDKNQVEQPPFGQTTEPTKTLLSTAISSSEKTAATGNEPPIPAPAEQTKDIETDSAATSADDEDALATPTPANPSTTLQSTPPAQEIPRESTRNKGKKRQPSEEDDPPIAKTSRRRLNLDK